MNKNIIRGYAYEFLVAQSIIDNSPMSKGLSLEDNQCCLLYTSDAADDCSIV